MATCDAENPNALAGVPDVEGLAGGEPGTATALPTAAIPRASSTVSGSSQVGQLDRSGHLRAEPLRSGGSGLDQPPVRPFNTP
jgi:hypothetical protein